MSGDGGPYVTQAVERADVRAGFSCGKHALVDAKDAEAEAFYGKYDFVVVTSAAWPRRMFLPIGAIRAAFEP